MEPPTVIETPRPDQPGSAPPRAVEAIEAAETPRRWLRASRMERIVLAALALAAWAIVLVAMVLVPSPSGLGTHEQLGLQPCAFHRITGRPCPGCGMTTAFAAMAHGRVLDALKAQPFGAVVFVLVLVAGLVLGAAAVSGRSVKPMLYSQKAPLVIYGLVILWLLGWGFKTLYMEVT